MKEKLKVSWEVAKVIGNDVGTVVIAVLATIGVITVLRLVELSRTFG